MTKKRWTKEEDDILIANYASNGIDNTLKLLPGRTRKAIILRAFKFKLKLPEAWSLEEENELIMNYPTKGVAGCNINKSSAAIHIRAKKLGIKGPKSTDLLKWNNEIYDNKLFETQLDVYRIEDYINSRTPILHECSKEHQWKAKPANIIHSLTGCPKCAIYGFDYSAPAILYYIKINGYYKLGITNRTVNDRYDNNRQKKDIEIIDEMHFDVGKDAYNYEQLLINKYAIYSAINTGILSQNGSTELFTVDILNGKIPNL